MKIAITIAIAFLLGTTNVMAQPKQGMLADEIALPSVQGDTLRLSSLKGKVVLLDFWASWCAPCRASNKVLVNLYAKYKNKGFEIFSVSIDDNAGKWENAIKKDKITWLQVNEPGGFNASTAVHWGIYGIPTTFLIDKEGRLQEMDLEGKMLERSIKELLRN
ncbi:MAG TPA: TlpA disulfide reductase family protein [Chitinophagaceae bacterium]|jgi:thiol-disulfide isomerase/thioredoxin|nr:TlpA disulfide reductase family protein [Chitinophagaceae bacterium]HMU59641.1 TlpA disulfide reductase family protein [Chitinophagaceae bacterium]